MEQERWLGELTTFLRIPSISTLPAHDADCRRAAEWVAGDLRRLGCRDVQLLGSDTHPVVWGVGPDVPGAPTVLLYGHYDVQPPDPINEWTSPPFEPSLRNGRLYARGAADDKGQVFCLLRAIEGLGAPPVNFRFLIEGEEEFGSKILFDLLRREPERTRADVALVADMSYVAPGWPAVYTSLRGMCYAELSVRTAKHDLHSGEYGGAAPNARERAAWKRLPFREKDFLNRRVQAKALTGLKSHSVLERLWALPTFEIHGITGGFTGAGAKTVIPAEAVAKVSLRLVPNQKMRTVERQLAAAVKKLAPKYVTATVRFLHGADPARVKIDHPAFALLDRAFHEVVGRGTVPARAGGSIPVVPALSREGAAVLLTGIGLPDDRLHAPDEKLDLQQLWDGIRVFGRFYQLMGERRA